MHDGISRFSFTNAPDAFGQPEGNLYKQAEPV